VPAWSLRNTLLTLAVLLGVLALLAWATSGIRIVLGRLHVSATDPTRVLLEATVVWLIAEIAAPCDRQRSWRILLPTMAVLLVAIMDSTPQRVGDGGEYVAMAESMSRGGAPALLPGERDALTEEMRGLSGFEDTTLEESLVGWDGRQDFYHFWFYPLIAVPFAIVTRLCDVHVNYAFTSVNLLLIGALIWWLARGGRADAAALLAAGPLLWWVDKAHTEVFMFVLLAFAALLIDVWPAAAVMAAGLATAQNPAAGIILAMCLVSIALRGTRAGVPVSAVLAALAIAAAAPVYYGWHLGVWSPLSGTIGRDLPGIRALLTPALDPNLGLLEYAPVLSLMVALGLSSQPRRSLLLLGSAILALLVVFAESGNVNHGGSPGVSRYALWVIALSTPFLVSGVEWLHARRLAIWRLAAVASVVFSVFVFRPAWPDRGGDAPNWFATVLWSRWPAIDNPLPEVFAERAYGSGGSAPVPISTSRCEKILIRGDGQDAWFPVPCMARPAPPMCRAAAALCYVNDGQYATVPAQPTFTYDSSRRHAWTWRNSARFDPLLLKLGSDLRFVRLADPGGRVENVRELDHLYIVEGSRGVAAWVRSMPLPAVGAVRLNVARTATLELFDADTFETIGPDRTFGPGLHDVTVPAELAVIMLLSDGE
jgi:hypothetical protein